MKYFIAGGAGFIGSELSRELLKDKNNHVVVYDNLSTGNMSLIHDMIGNSNFLFIKADIKNMDSLIKAMLGCDAVYHFASNADIAKAIGDPTVDFNDGTLLTQNILEAMRICGVKKIYYASGSGVYGDIKHIAREEDSVAHPISTYGASKVAGETLISAYCHMFDMNGIAYRFANVVGKNSTHGVIKDFIDMLLTQSKQSPVLPIKGNGKQKKSYIHVSDIISALNITRGVTNGFEVYNVAPSDQIKVVEIADLVCTTMGLYNASYEYYDNKYADGRGWRGDVPFISMDSSKIKSLGWKPTYNSREAVIKAIGEKLKNEAYI